MSGSAGGDHYRELPGGGTLAYSIETDDAELRRELQQRLNAVVGEVRAEYE